MSDDPNTAFRSTPGTAAAARAWSPFAGYAMPIQYEGIIAEHLWTRDSAGLFDVSHMGQLHRRRRRGREGARGAAPRRPRAS